MDDAILQAYARLSAHQFLLEAMYAEVLAQMTAEDARRVATELAARMRSVQVPAGADMHFAEKFGLQVARDAADLTNHFLKRVMARAAELRAAAAAKNKP